MGLLDYIPFIMIGLIIFGIAGMVYVVNQSEEKGKEWCYENGFDGATPGPNVYCKEIDDQGRTVLHEVIIRNGEVQGIAKR